MSLGIAISSLSPLLGVDVDVADLLAIVHPAESDITKRTKNIRHDEYSKALSSSILSQKMVFASKNGVVFDANPAVNTGTNNTAAIQDMATGGDICIVMDGDTNGKLALSDTIYLESNTTIMGLRRGVGLFKKGALNAGLPLIVNKNWVSGPTTPTDFNISILNIDLDCNRRHYGSGNTLIPGHDAINAYWFAVNDDGYCVSGIGIFGCSGLTIERVRLTDTPSFGLWLANIPAFPQSTVRNFEKWSLANDYNPTNEPIHINGHVHDVLFENISGSSSDDFIALNGTDGNDLGPGTVPNLDPRMVVHGPISGLSFRGMRSPSCAQAFRFLSGLVSASITDITIEDGAFSLSGLNSSGYGYTGFQFDDFGTGDGSHGYTDGIRIRNIDLFGNITDGQYPVKFSRCNVGLAEISNLRNRAYEQLFQVGGPHATMLFATGSATIGRLVFNTSLNETTAPIANSLYFDVGATVGAVEINGGEYDLAIAGPGYPQPNYEDIAFMEMRTPINEVAIRNVKARYITSILKCTGAVPVSLQMDDNRLLGSQNAAGALVSSDTPLYNWNASGNDAPRLALCPDGSSAPSNGRPHSPLLVTADLGIIVFDVSRSNRQAVTLGADRVVTVSNMLVGDILILYIGQDATGNRHVTQWLGNTVSWAGGSPPVLSAGAGKVDLIQIEKTSVGGYIGTVLDQNIVRPPGMGYLLIDHGSAKFTGPSTGATVTLNTSNANRIIIATGWSTFAPSGLAVTDSKGNTPIGRTQQAGSALAACQLYDELNPTVGSGHQFSLTGTNLFGSIAVLAFAGSGPFSAENGYSYPGSGPGQTGAGEFVGNVNVPANGLYVGAFATEVLTAVPVVDFRSGTTPIILDPVTPVFQQCVALSLAYGLQGAAGAINAWWTGGGFVATPCVAACYY